MMHGASRRAPWAAVLFLALAASSCRDGISRPYYVRAWVVASLRAFEKETSVRGEILVFYRADGYAPDDWTAAEAAWFGEDTTADIDQRILRIMSRKKDLSRSRYIRLRSLAYARSRARRGGFAKELRLLLGQHGLSPSAWEAAELVWIGDRDTDRELHQAVGRFERALALVPLPVYVDVWARARAVRSPRAGGEEARRRSLCRARGLPEEAWRTVADLWDEDEDVEKRIRLRAEALRSGPQSP